MSISAYPRAILVGCLLALPLLMHTQSVKAQEGYFSRGDKQVPVVKAGTRSDGEHTVVLSILGAAALAGAVGTYYARDTSSLSDKIPTARDHTNRAWSNELEDIRSDAERSATIAKVSLGIGGALLAAGIATWIITDPKDVVTSRDMQSRLQRFPSLSIPTEGGLVVRQSWTY